MRFSLASLLAECCWAGILPGEKRQCPRWRSGRWHQQWPSRCFLFFLAQVSQYSIDDVLVLDTGDDPDRSAATATDLDIDVEDAFEPLRPGHGGMTLGGCADFCVGDGLDAFTAPGWRDEPAPAVVWCQDAMVAELGVPVPLTLGFGTRAANLAMKSTGSKATWVVPSRCG